MATEQYHEGQLSTESAMTYAGIAPLMAAEFPEVEAQVRLAIWIGNDIVFQYKDKAVREKDFFFAEPAFFNVFSFQLKKGNRETALSEPNTVVLTEKIAKKLFGEEDPIGKIIQHESRSYYYTVTGIIEETPEQSHLKYGILASYATWDGSGFADTGVYGDNHFDYFYAYSYILLHPQANPKELAQQLTNKVQLRKKESETQDRFLLQPLTDIHLYSNLQYELQPTANGRNLWVLLLISMIIVVLAWVNYYNISMTATLDHRTAIGVRKVIGAKRRHIIYQLFIENLLHTLIALSLGLGLTFGCIPLIEQLFGTSLWNSSLWENSMLSPILLILLFISTGTILTTLLPAISMSSVRPIQLFRKSFYFSALGLDFRKGLIVLQFMIIIGLLASSMVVLQQSNYMEQKDLGIDLTNVLIVKGPLGTAVYEDINPAHIAFKNQLKAIPSVIHSAVSTQIPGNDLDLLNELKFKDEVQVHHAPASRLVISPSYFQIYDVPLVAGDLSQARSKGKRAVVLNETAVRQMGFQKNEDVLGRHINYYSDDHEIVGVVKDYHHYSLHQPVPSIIFDMVDAQTEGLEDGYFSIKMNTSNYQQYIPLVKEAFEASYPGTVFEYFDIEATYQRQYKANNDFRLLNLVFTVLAFFIACLGLLALSMIMIEKRIKEIGIRKILGASVSGLLLLLSRDFLKLVTIGWIIAIPLSWYALSSWLQNFAYRIEIGWWVFLLAGCIAMLLTLITIGLNGLKTARMNPVYSLRSEG